MSSSVTSAKKYWRLHVAGILFVLLAGCASIDFDYPRIESTAPTDTDDTFLGSQLTELVESKPEAESGFYPLLDGIDALTARLLLAEQAERTIDTQYYLIKTDQTSISAHEEMQNLVISMSLVCAYGCCLMTYLPKAMTRAWLHSIHIQISVFGSLTRITVELWVSFIAVPPI